jgi:hypothetical protein
MRLVRRNATNRMEPVKVRVAILAANPPDNIPHETLWRWHASVVEF